MANVASALIYLRATSLKNAVQSRLLRLKQPKYLLGAVVGGAYLYFVFLRRVRPNTGAGPAALASLPTDLSSVIVAAAALALTVAVALTWIVPRARASLNFSESEIAFLFPAPVARRTLIHYRLISSQLTTVLSALILGLISTRWSFIPGGIAIRLVGWWIIFGTFGLHFTGSSFVITKLLDRGLSAPRRQLIALGIAALVIVGLAVWAGSGLRAPTQEDLTGLGPFVTYLSGLLERAPLSWLLLPATFVVRPMFAPDASAFLVALVPALLVYAAHYLWVVHVNVSFEEGSIDLAAKRAARLAAIRSGRRLSLGRSKPKARRDPFALAPAGRPEIAFLWKNLLSTADYLRPRTALIAAGAITVVCLWLDSHPDYEPLRVTIGFVSLVMMGYLLLFGPMFAAQDFRGDLQNADLLKVYPLPAWQIAAGEILTPVAVLTGLLWLLLLTAALSLQVSGAAGLSPAVRAGLALGLGLAAPPICALELTIINAATLMFPAWLTPSAQRSARGIEGMGLRIVFLLAQTLVIGLALLPALVPALVVFALSRWLLGSVVLAGVLAAAFVLIALVAEVAAGLWWLGARFARFDLSAELKP